MSRVISAESYEEHTAFRLLQLLTAICLAVSAWLIVDKQVPVGVAFFGCIVVVVLAILLVAESSSSKPSGRGKSKKQKEADESCKGTPYTYFLYNAWSPILCYYAYQADEPVWGLMLMPAVWAIFLACMCTHMWLSETEGTRGTFNKWSEINKEVQK